MGTILDQIVTTKRIEVAERKQLKPIRELEKTGLFSTAVYSMKSHLLSPEKSGIIAEIKRKSPSKGVINNNVDVSQIAKDYVTAGASGVSILTDTTFFGGSSEDFQTARKSITAPILRKDFIIDEYQIIEAKSMGTDLILLIAACLSSHEIAQFSALTKSLGMEVLLEVHDQSELDGNLGTDIDIVGVNNRNLKTFETTLDCSFQLADLIPSEFTKISESGLNNPNDLIKLRNAGFDGFLMGESFMKTKNPGATSKAFMSDLKELLVK